MWNSIKSITNCCLPNREEDPPNARSDVRAAGNRRPGPTAEPAIPLSTLSPKPPQRALTRHSTSARLLRMPALLRKTAPQAKDAPERHLMAPSELSFASERSIEMQALHPSMRPLGEVEYKLHHPHYGNLSIKRCAKSSNASVVIFELRRSTGEPFRHQMYVSDKDQAHSNKSTLSYSDIFLPQSWQGKGISYAYHYAAAMAARDIGVDLFAIDNVISPYLQQACDAMGMTEVPPCGYFEAEPATVIDAARAKMAEKAWSSLD